MNVYYYVRKDRDGNIVSGSPYGGTLMHGDERDIEILRVMDEQEGTTQKWRGTTIEIVSEEVAMSYLDSVKNMGRSPRKEGQKKRRKKRRR